MKYIGVIVALLLVWAVCARQAPKVRADDEYIDEEYIEEDQFVEEPETFDDYRQSESSQAEGDDMVNWDLYEPESAEPRENSQDEVQHQSSSALNFQTGNVKTVGSHIRMNRSGRRSNKVYVSFPRPFNAPPKIMVSLKMVDSHRGRNLRLDVYAINVSRDGFTLEFVTWADTIIYGASASWLAFGV